MGIITQEQMAEYFIKEVLNRFKKDMEVEGKGDLSGDELAEQMWKNKAQLGEAFYEELFDYIGGDDIDNYIE